MSLALAGAEEEAHRLPIDLGEAREFHHVETPLTPFAFGYPGLSTTKPPPDLLLREARTLPCQLEASEQHLIAPVIDW